MAGTTHRAAVARLHSFARQFRARRFTTRRGHSDFFGQMLIPASRHILRIGRKTRVGKGRLFKFISNPFQTRLRPKHLEKMRKARLPFELRRDFHRKTSMAAKKGEFGWWMVPFRAPTKAENRQAGESSNPDVPSVNELRRLAPQLRTHGIHVTFTRTRKNRLIAIESRRRSDWTKR